VRRRRRHASSQPRVTRARLVFVLNSLLNLVYFDVAQKMLNAFGCTLRSSSGRPYLNSVPATSCELGGGSEYTPVLAMAVLGTLVYVVGYPVAMAVQMRLARRRAASADARQRFPSEASAGSAVLRESLIEAGDSGATSSATKRGAPEAMQSVSFFTASYRARFWWYEYVVLARRLAMALTVALVPFTAPLALLFSFAVVFIASLLAHQLLHPFRTRLDNRLESVSLYVLLIVLVGTSTVTSGAGSGSGSEAANDATASAIVVVMIVLALALALGLVVLIVMQLLVGVCGARCCARMLGRFGMSQQQERAVRQRARRIARVLGEAEAEAGL